MTVVSAKEFNTNQEKYFDMAIFDTVVIERGENMFSIKNFKANNEADVIFEPDDDFYRSISIEELRASAHEHIHKLFTK